MSKSYKKYICICCGIILIIIAKLLGRTLVESVTTKTPAYTTYLAQNPVWNTTQLANTNLYFETPYPLKQQPLPINKNLGDNLDEIQSYTINFPGGVENTIGYYKFKVPYNFDLSKGIQGSVNGALSTIKRNGSVSDIHINTKSLVISNIPTKRSDVYFSYQGQKMHAIFILIGDGKRYVWNIIFNVKIQDDRNYKVINRVIKSLEIK